MTVNNVPTQDEVRAWELEYNARYRAKHRARNAALASMFEEESTPMRIDHTVAHVEGELEAALGLMQLDHEVIAKARGDGYEVGRAQAPADAPAYENFDEFMAWHAGWHQGYPREVNRDLATRERGYTPPSRYRCPLCGELEGRYHTGPKRRHPADPYSYTTFGVQEMCEDHLIVVRAPVRAPVRRPGVTFT
jgi:hypothetical protein